MLCLTALVLEAQSPVRISLISGGDRKETTSQWLVQSIQDEVKTLLRNRYEVEFDIVFVPFDMVGVNAELDKAFADPEVDIVVAAGVMSSIILAQRTEFPKPALATVVVDKELQKVPITSEGTSGINNFSYIQTPTDIDRDLRTFYSIYPYKKLGVIGTPNIATMLPVVDELFERITDDLGTDLAIIPAAGDGEVINKIKADEEIDAIYVMPLLDQATEAQISQFFHELNMRGIPSMALVGETMIEAGAMMGYEANPNLQRIPRRVAAGCIKNNGRDQSLRVEGRD